MPDILFTCECRMCFQRYKRDGEEWIETCPDCGKEVTDALGPHGLNQSYLRLPNDQYDYISPVDGSYIASKRAHREHLKRHGLIEFGNDKPRHQKQLHMPRESIRQEMRNQLERMKSDGSWRER